MVIQTDTGTSRDQDQVCRFPERRSNRLGLVSNDATEQRFPAVPAYQC